MVSRIVVAGGSLAGQSAVSELISLAPESEILWITGESLTPYSKPALSKEFMQGRYEVSDLTLPDVESGDARLRIIRGQPCISLEASGRSVRLAGDSSVEFDNLLVCTGATARIPAAFEGIDGVYKLRTLEDAVAIRSQLARRPRVLVVGGGLIGCEFAASIRGLGLEVTIVEQLETLLERPFGGALAGHFLDLHRRNGVEVLLGVSVDRLLTRDGKASGAILSDGTEIEAELVVIGTGAQPATQWLEGSGIELADGVVCDACLAASQPGIYAAGDIARWHNPLFGMDMRVEHWTNASAQGRAAAHNLVAAAAGRPEQARPFADVPYFWSDQFGQKIQMVGWHRGHDRVELERPNGAPGPIVRFYRDRRLVAAAGVNAPRVIMGLRRQIDREMGEPDYARVS